MGEYRALFDELARLRAAAPLAAHQPDPLPLSLDPVRLFAGFASAAPPSEMAAPDGDLPAQVRQGRQGLWQMILAAVSEDQRAALLADLQRKHLQP
jgi:hypothetical protein